MYEYYNVRVTEYVYNLSNQIHRIGSAFIQEWSLLTDFSANCHQRVALISKKKKG